MVRRALGIGLLSCVSLGVGCRGSGPYNGPMPAPGTPLTGTLDGERFVPRGVIGRVISGDLWIYVFDRPAQCGTLGADPQPGEQFFQVFLPAWASAPPGAHVDLWNSTAAVNTARRLPPPQNGGSAVAMSGGIDILASGPTGGALSVEARSRQGRLTGQLSFPICP